MVGPVHLALFIDQWGGRGLLSQGRMAGPFRGGLRDGGQQPVGAKTLNSKAHASGFNGLHGGSRQGPDLRPHL